MRVTPSKLLRLEAALIEEFKTTIDIPAPSIPIENNLSISYSVLRSEQENNSIAIRMKARTIKKTQLQFHIVVTFVFNVLESELLKEKKDFIIPTMVSISYSTLRGILLRELPLVDLRNRILPPVDLPILLKAREKSKAQPQKTARNDSKTSRQKSTASPQ